jgi:hypothetical protein
MKKPIKTLLFIFLGLNAMAQNTPSTNEKTLQEVEKEWFENNPDPSVKDYSTKKEAFFKSFGLVDAQKTTRTSNEGKIENEKIAVVPEFSNQAEKDAWVRSQNKQEERKVDPYHVSKIEAEISNEAEKDAYLQKRQSVVYVTQAEFDALPYVKQAAMLSDKNFIIVK